MKCLLKIKTLLAVFVLLVFASCSGVSQEEYVKVIPSDITNLVSVDFGSLIKKSGINSADKVELISKSIDQMGDEVSPSTSAMLHKIVADPAVSGVDLSRPIYFYATLESEDDSENYLTVVSKMGDKLKFDELIAQLVKEKVVTAPVEAEGYTYSISLDKEDIIAFNDEVIIMLSASSEKDIVAIVSQMINLPEEECVYAKSDFEKMQSCSGDIKFLGMLDRLPSQFTMQLKSQIKATGADVTKYRFAGGVEFNKGEVKFNIVSYTLDPELQKYIDKMNAISAPMNGDLLNTIPSDALMAFAAYINGDLLYENLQNNKELVKEYFGNDEETNIILQNLLKSLDGDVVISPVRVNSATDFSVRLLAEVDESASEALGAFFDTGMLEKAERVGEDEYELRTPFVTIYFGIKDGVFYLLNSKSDVESIGKKASNSIVSQHPNIKGVATCMVVNVKDVFAVLDSFRLLGFAKSKDIEVLKEISFIESTASLDMNSTLRVVFVNQDENSLKVASDYVFNHLSK